MRISKIIILAAIAAVAGCSRAPVITPGEIFNKVTTAYESLQTYKAEGTIVSDFDTGQIKLNTDTSFLILLKKPNLYLISWTQKNRPMAVMNQNAAVWSDGTQPYLYMGMMNAYSKMGDDKFALSSATGISGGAASTIPSLFFSLFKERGIPFSRLKEAKIDKIEKVGAEDCYVISGASPTSKMETFWISKSRHLIVKYVRSFEAPEGGVVTPEMTDEQVDEAIKGMGQKVTEENRKSIREIMNRSKDVLKTTKVKGSSTEIHVKISSPELDKADFHFVLPQSAVMKDSLFGSVFSGGK